MVVRSTRCQPIRCRPALLARPLRAPPRHGLKAWTYLSGPPEAYASAVPGFTTSSAFGASRTDRQRPAMAFYDDDIAPLTDSGDESASPGPELLLGDDGFPARYNSDQDASDSDSAPVGEEQQDEEEATVMAARAYQLEMLKASLEGNTIVAMDTGSGKTQVAVLRIIAELERSSPDKIIWFLAPTVPLCSQQYEVLASQVPAVQMKLLTGEDNVDSWSEQKVWDAALLNTRLVVSTYQVLLDALIHSFVKLASLGLIIFDEAHNCSKRNPGRRIMTEFYWPAKNAKQSIPSILGLTASPVMGSRLEGLEELEQTLDAVCRSPTQHREELLAHVKRPTMMIDPYDKPVPASPRSDFTQNMLRLESVVQRLDILKDPYVIYLRQQNSEKSRRQLETTLMKHDTKIMKQVQSFCRKSVEICRDLGTWAADYYIHEVVRRYTSKMPKEHLLVDDLDDAEDLYLYNIFQAIQATAPPSAEYLSGSNISPKLQALLNMLSAYDGNPVGIVFAKERATVAVLSHILSIHPKLSARYSIGAMVGTSTGAGKRQDILNLSQTEDLQSLHRFRNGKVNLLVATSVLEEGIDVPACNLVVCLDRPESLKSFIQRRGRARLHSSQLHLFVARDSDGKSAEEWLALEEEMKRRYEDEMRELQELEMVEESDIPDFAPLRVEATGAQLTLDDAKSHLQHFCATLSSRKFVAWKPEYVIDAESAAPLLRATVLLPVSLPQGLRQATSSRAWRSEKNACKDAAFQAYKALYYAKLLNDNLLPIRESDLGKEVELRASLANIKEQYNPWHSVARAWSSRTRSIHQCGLRLLDEEGSELCQFSAILPVSIPKFTPLSLYLDHHSTVPLTLERSQPSAQVEMADALDHTSTLLAMSYGHRWPMSHRHQLVRFALPGTSLKTHLIGSRPFHPDIVTHEDGDQYLVRDELNCPYIYDTWVPSKPSINLVRDPYRGFEDSPEDMPYLIVKKWPKKAGFFQPQPPNEQQENPSSKPYARVLPAPECTVDQVSMLYARIGMLIPSITHALEVHLVASELLASTKLGELGISDLSLIKTAISAPSARESTDYERVEFLGDCLLKLCTTINCASQNLHWPEGYLSLLKDKLVANSRLSRAAVALGLDQFIITRQFTLREWRTLYESDLTAPEDLDEQTRNLSTKTLADVVEALIGVSYIHGGMPKALHCISLFLPERNWQNLETGRAILYEAAPSDMKLPAILEPLEELIGYSFKKKSLLIEAMTHSSYNVPGTTACLERFEFIGDAILDSIVVNKLFAADGGPPLANYEMHLLRTALVNGDFLGFLVMEFGTKMLQCDIVAEGTRIVRHEVTTPLWKFMRHSSAELGAEQRAAERRHAAVRERILEALEGGQSYPWALLARLRAQKFYSDLFESLLGALWVDSGGDEAACEDLLERAGLLPYLRRALRDEIHMWHPKEELGRLADREKVVYAAEMREPDEEEGGGDGDRERYFVCRVTVGTDFSVEVGDGVSKDVVKIKAAEEAVRLWKERAARGVM